MTDEVRRFALYLPKQTKDRLKRLSYVQERPMATLVTEAINDYLAKEEPTMEVPAVWAGEVVATQPDSYGYQRGG